jgi:hypothetical protein
VERHPAGESATCELVRAALPLADERLCRSARDACDACCRSDPPTPAAWNTVVASLVFRAASAVAASPDAGREAVVQATDARNRAAERLDLERPAPDRGRPATSQFVRLDDLIPGPVTRGVRSISQWAVGITTAPRRQPTVERCVDRLTRAGWESPHLFMDGPVRIPERFGHLPGTLREPPVGAWPNHYLALFELTLRQPTADAFLILQDDALIYDGENVREYLERTMWPDAAHPVVSLYCPGPYTGNRYGWRRFREPWVWGAQAFVFSREAAQTYLLDRRVCLHRWRDGGLAQLDVLIGWWALRRRIPLWYPTPSLVQHVGDASTLYPECSATGPRAASLFVGSPA